MTPFNILSLGKLFDEFERERLEKKIIISPEIVLPIAYEKFSTVHGHHCELYRFTEAEEIEAYKYILSEMAKRNLELSQAMGRFYPCTFTNHNHFIIDPEGKIYKCAFMMGFDTFCMGTIEQENYDSTFENCEYLLSSPVCSDCIFLPICGGGCKYKSWLKYKDFTKVYCEKKLLQEIQPMIIEYVYRDKIKEHLDAFEKTA